MELIYWEASYLLIAKDIVECIMNLVKFEVVSIFIDLIALKILFFYFAILLPVN